MSNDLSAARAAAAAAMHAQTARLRVVTENIANADTPGYRRKLITFEQAAPGAARGPAPAVAPGPLRLSGRELPLVHDPHHPLADESGHYRGSGVDLVVEIADAREAQRSYEASLRVFDQARQMGSALLDLIRR
ncbi:MAG: flagellar basal body rod protein FlgC [Rhodobacteraceae bacterium]|nr:flagellar basal body rod protein FlgC [Paracoccaceae bacterium]